MKHYIALAAITVVALVAVPTTGIQIQDAASAELDSVRGGICWELTAYKCRGSDTCAVGKYLKPEVSSTSEDIESNAERWCNQSEPASCSQGWNNLGDCFGDY